jgi:hypothetical protein
LAVLEYVTGRVDPSPRKNLPLLILGFSQEVMTCNRSTPQTESQKAGLLESTGDTSCSGAAGTTSITGMADGMVPSWAKV